MDYSRRCKTTPITKKPKINNKMSANSKQVENIIEFLNKIKNELTDEEVINITEILVNVSKRISS